MLKTLLCVVGFSASFCIAQKIDAKPSCGPVELVDGVPALSAQQRNGNQSAKLPGGYTLSITQNVEEVEDACKASIVDSKGKTVYSTQGFSLGLSEPVGADLDGDGHAEVVLSVDTGGGNHCCWGYEIISFYPKVHKIAGETAGAGGMDFAKDEKGRWILKTGYALDGWTSEADRPFGTRIFRFESGKSIDVTPEYCGTLIDMDDLNGLSVEEIDQFRSGSLDKSENWDRERFVSGVLREALQYAFCRKPREALEAFDIWPEQDRKKVIAEFIKSFSEEYPQMADQFAHQFEEKQKK